MLEVRVPGDKSITHRALMLGALADGVSRITGGLVAEDTKATAGALRALGVAVPPLSGTEWIVPGVGVHGLRGSDGAVDCGNSGTTARLLLGILAGVPGGMTVTGDASLSARPMRRVTDPLSLMGARFTELGAADRLPIKVEGGPLAPIDYRLPVASAQIKSALLLAGITGRAWVLLTEPGRSRDHTERMLGALGVPLVCHPGPQGGWRVELREPPERIRAGDVSVPGDFSSAAYPVVLGLLRAGSEPLRVEDVGLNPTRTGLLNVLRRMGARIEEERREGEDSEPRGDLVVHPSVLTATDVEPEEIPSLLDEVPVLAVAAARARGTTTIRGAGELKVKESDRLSGLATNLRAVGVTARAAEDTLEVVGTNAPLRGTVQTLRDHRLGMAFGVLASLPANEIQVDRPEVVRVSYPDFWDMLQATSGPGSKRTPTSPAPSGVVAPSGVAAPSVPGVVVTLDGPAGSGKSSTAREVARRLGIRHLDSGALYRAVTYAVLAAGHQPDDWDRLTLEDVRSLGVDLAGGETGYVVTVRGSPIPDERLRASGVTRHVSRLSRVPAVREALLEVQRRVAERGGLVADGRDMGTVVFPHAHAKFFLVASLERRAARRLAERGQDDPDDRAVAAEAQALRERDQSDATRALAPLRRPEDATVIDTTQLSFEDQVTRVVEAVRALTG